MLGYIDFLKDVYGIETFIRPCHLIRGVMTASINNLSGAAASFYNSQASLQFVILKEADIEFSSEEKDLFEKIIAALKKNLSDIHLQVVTVLSAAQINSGKLVLMSANPKNLNIAPENFPSATQTISTYDPATLLAHPQHKKEVWTQLQSL